MTVKVKINNLHFQYQLKVSQDACLEQIWWYHLKPVTSYWADKVYGRTDGRRQRHYPFGLKGQGVKMDMDEWMETLAISQLPNNTPPTGRAEG